MRPSSTTSSSMGDRGQVYHESIVIVHQRHQISLQYVGVYMPYICTRNFNKECRIIDMSKYSILTPSSDFITDLIFYLGH